MSNYTKGARLERCVRKELEAQGYIVIRSAGSKGVVDLVAFDARLIRLIQVKAHGAARPADLLNLRHIIAPRNATRELWVAERRGGWRILRVKP